MGHVALLGDSIFDNARYVPGGPAGDDHLKRYLPANWRTTLLAVDGALTSDVFTQVDRLPADITHLVVSAGGNNALDQSGTILHDPASSFAEVLTRLGSIRHEFQREYRAMVQRLRTIGKPTVVCTVYDSIPGLSPAELTGLAVFNEVILREAAHASLPVIDLRLICADFADYAQSSPIEPSVAGGGKIARAITRVLADHDFAAGGCRIYA